MPGLQARSPVRGVYEKQIHIDVSLLSLSPSLPLSLKINKQYLFLKKGNHTIWAKILDFSLFRYLHLVRDVTFLCLSYHICKMGIRVTPSLAAARI